MLVINVQGLKSRKANMQMKQIFQSMNILGIVRLDAHSPSLSMQVKKQVASNEAAKTQTQNKHKELTKLWIPLHITVKVYISFFFFFN